jgi:hypothetical protein
MRRFPALRSSFRTRERVTSQRGVMEDTDHEINDRFDVFNAASAAVHVAFVLRTR